MQNPKRSNIKIWCSNLDSDNQIYTRCHFLSSDDNHCNHEKNYSDLKYINNYKILAPETCPRRKEMVNKVKKRLLDSLDNIGKSFLPKNLGQAWKQERQKKKVK